MIRINLLPIKKQRAAASGRNFLFVAVAIILVEAVTLGVLHASGASERNELQRLNADARARVEIIKNQIKGHEEILAKLKQIEGREQIIAKLQSARTGPVYMLMEMAGVLGQGPRVPPEVLAQQRHDNPLTALNNRWDGRRLWLTGLTENNREVKIEGLARGHDDVAEFLRRLTISAYFEDEQLVRTQVAENSDLHMELVSFEIDCKARYQ